MYQSSFQSLNQLRHGPSQLLNLSVLHVIFSPSAGSTENPLSFEVKFLLQLRARISGARSTPKEAVAVIMGAVYDDAAIAEMLKACQGARNVPWLEQDLTKAAPPLGKG